MLDRKFIYDVFMDFVWLFAYSYGLQDLAT